MLFLRISDAHDHRRWSTFMMQNLKESHIIVLVVVMKAGVSCMYVLAIRQEFQTVLHQFGKIVLVEQSKQRHKGSERG